MKRNAFTMLEMVFVIVILGILAAIAVPKLAATRDDAQIVKGRSDVSAIRTAIVNERQARLLKGQSNYITRLHNTTTGLLFDDNDSNESNGGTLLQYGIAPKHDKNGHWQDTIYTSSTGNNAYVFRVMDQDIYFEYNSTTGKFDCNHSVKMCQSLTE